MFQRNAVDGHFGDAVEIHGTARARTRQVFDVDVAEARSGFVNRHGRHFCGNYLAAFEHFDRRLASVIQVERNRLGSDVNHRHVAHPDVLYHTAAPALALEAQPDIGAEELAIADRNIAHAAAHLAAHDKASMPLEDRTAVYDDVLARTRAPAAVFVLPALEADAVIAHIEGGIDYQGIAA